MPPIDSQLHDENNASIAPLRVVCLCAAWCRTCEGYQDTFAEVAADFSDVPFYWIDVEDRYDLIGDLDIETFPTIAIFAGDEGDTLVHLSAMLPQAGVLRRLVRHTMAQDNAPPLDIALCPEGTADMVLKLSAHWAKLSAL